MCVYGACLFYVCCSDCVESVGMFVVYRPLLKIAFLVLECLSMLYICIRGGIDVIFSVCIVRRGAVGARVWEV